MSLSRGKLTRLKLLPLFYLLVVVSPPFALLFAETVTGTAGFGEFMRSFTVLPLAALSGSAAAAGILLVGIIRFIRRKNDPGNVVILHVFALLWGPFHNVLFSLLFHGSSPFGNTPDIQVAAGMYAGAVGLFFATLMLIGASEELDALVTRSDSGRVRAGNRLSFKFVLCITVTVTAFLVGAVGVVSLLFVAGFSTITLLPRMSVVALPFLGLTLVLVYFLIRVTTDPVSRSVPKFQALRENDLDQVLEATSHDEIGLLFESVNGFLSRLRGMIALIRTMASDTNERSLKLLEAMNASKSSSAEVSEIATGLKDIVINQSATVNEVASGIEEIVKTIESQDKKIADQAAIVNERSASIEEMIGNIRTIAENLNRNSLQFDTLQQYVKAGAERLSELNTYIAGLSEKSMHVTEANAVISGIASQTNLLAMNAAIEAAHAGEAGKGFSVVADEIRKLAETANVQSKQIAADIEALGDAIVSASHLSDQTGESFAGIQSAVAAVTGIENHVKRSLDELSSGTAQILQALSGIGSITSEVRDGSREMVIGGNETLFEIEGLVSVTTSMKDSTMGIIERIAAVNSMIIESTAVVNATVESITSISREIGKFRVTGV